MLFNAPEFILVFLPVTLAVFFALGSMAQFRAALAWLVAASLFFYGWWEPRYLLLILVSVLANFLFGLWLSRCRHRPERTPVLCLGVAANLGLIGYFKYSSFLVASVGAIAGAEWSIAEVLLPIGVSFFTFQQIAYLVDVARGETQETDLLTYSLFVTFFPQLIAGPILHHKEMLPQFRRPETFRPSAENLCIGGTIFVIGLFKKVVIADNFGLIASPVFAEAETGATLHFIQAWRGAFAFSFQLYFDFSGYSDMAIGLARLFGIRLPLNFNSPYKATSIIDFWRRWHMTLSRFLRDYLYFALGGNRKGPARRYVNLMITMLLGGLWHGAAWTFVLWGGIHGFFVIVNHLWRRVFRRTIDRWWSRLTARSLTMVIIVLAWVPFRAESLDGALAVFDGMTNLPYMLEARLGAGGAVLGALGFRFEGPWFTDADLRSVFWLGLSLALVWCLPNTQQWMAAYAPGPRAPDLADRPGPSASGGLVSALAWQPTVVWASVVAVLLSSSLLSLQRVTEFLYFQF